ncbi:hypothetical protein M5D96_006385 [Drosophila gunungcola]|uniref:Uncharacterized protein n=1 Tax=Drosophila gunungcola TaxID=103775 RepID=A0A9Q0BPZ4_9MUSC|nr:hypothetical protein M5D96_006385 [Drosophila gunungcola]
MVRLLVLTGYLVYSGPHLHGPVHLELKLYILSPDKCKHLPQAVYASCWWH